MDTIDHNDDYANISNFTMNDNVLSDTLNEFRINSDYSEVQNMKALLNTHKYKYYCLHINIHSLPNKLDSLKILLMRLEHIDIHIHFILLCETFLNNANVSGCNLPGYNILYKNRNSSKQGGVALYIDNRFPCKELSNIGVYVDGEFETIFAEVSDNNTKIVIGEIYRVPNTNENISILRFQETLDNINSITKVDEIIIGTDQNFDYVKLDNHTNTSILFNIFVSAGLVPTITKPTRITHTSATLIDNIYIKLKNSQIFSAIITYDISDHLPVITGLCKCPLKTDKKPLVIKSRKFDDQKINIINNEMMQINWDILNQLSVNDSYNVFINKMYEVLDKFAPEKNIKIPHKRIIKEDWMTTGLIKSCITRDKLYKKSLGKSQTHPSYLRFKLYRNTLKKLLRTAKQTFYFQQLNDYKNNVRMTWRTLNQLIGRKNDKSDISDLFIINNKPTTDQHVIAKEFCSFFTKIGQDYAENIKKATKSPLDYLGNTRNKESLFLGPTDKYEINKMILSLKSKVSVSHDGISTKFLKQLHSSVSLPLSIIINKSLAEGIVPDQLKIAKVVPIFKSDNKQLLNNYRPISLLPSVSKIMEKVVHNRLYSFLMKCGTFYPKQYGFRAKHSTSHAVTDFVSDVLNGFENKQYTLALFLDLSKAFDTIDHTILLKKLYFYGIRGLALKWFESYLSNREQYVQYKDVKSSKENIIYGVPQGSVLGPLLFIIYTNDLPNEIKRANTILFADDTTVYITSNNIGNMFNIMNEQLSILSDWFKANKLSLNINKTMYMLLSYQRNGPVYTDKIVIDGQNIKHVDKTKFLGVYIDHKLEWHEHINMCQGKLRSGLYALNAAKRYLSTTNLRMLYFSLIHPHLTYCNIIWGLARKKHTNKLLVLQKKAIRVVAKAGYNVHSPPLFRNLGILKLDDLYKQQLNKFVYLYSTNNLPLPLTYIYDINASIHTFNTRQKLDLHKRPIKTDIVFRSFLYQGPENWSKLPIHVRQARTTRAFCSQVKKLLISHYI